MTPRARLDVVVTIAVAVVLAVAVAAGLLAWAFSGWGDRPPSVPEPTPVSTPATPTL